MTIDIVNIDTDILLWINSMHTSLLDTFMWNVSSKYIWIPMYLLMVALLAKRYGWRCLWMLLAIGVAFGLSDYISHLLKHIVCRPRPTHEESLADLIYIVNDYRGGKYGFPSSHAADTMSLALLFSLIWRDWRTTLTLMLWVTANCLSRMYLGVHYPGDIVCGLLLGATFALGAYWVLRACKVTKKSETKISPHWLEYALPAIFFVTLIFSFIV